ncbi:hypothetical protein FBY12_2947 [Pseudomonas sp. SJZ131]|nr:hypothetical protein FBY12_2947 [Pseudomonas sp. SJZ131]
MSRRLGLREDQCWRENLVTRIVELLPVEPRWCHREQARSHIGFLLSPQWHEQPQNPVGTSSLAMGPEQSAKH